MVLVGCSEQQRPRAVAEKPEDRPPTHVSYDVHVHFTDSSRTKAILSSAVARLYEDRAQTTLGDTVIVDFYGKDGRRRAARLSADSAVVDDRSKNMTAFGNVVVYADSARTTLTTSILHWDNQRERLSSTAYVRIVTPTETIEGIGFESNQTLTDYRIFQVRGIQR